MTRLKTWFKKRWDWLKKNWDYTIAPIVVVVAVVVNNWNRGWFNALEGIDIVLIVAILLFFMGYLYILLRIIPTLEFVGRRVGKRKIQVFGTLLGSLVVFYLLWNLHGILPNKWVEISLLAGLVAVTSGLAVYAAAQAYASVKMAEEMRDTRYDALRPIIDIVDAILEPKEMATRAYNAREGIFPQYLPCRLRNVGVGPAIEVYSFIEDDRGETRRWDFHTIPVAIGKEQMGYTDEVRLLLEQRGNCRALVVYYKDVYGNSLD